MNVIKIGTLLAVAVSFGVTVYPSVVEPLSLEKKESDDYRKNGAIITFYDASGFGNSTSLRYYNGIPYLHLLAYFCDRVEPISGDAFWIDLSSIKPTKHELLAQFLTQSVEQSSQYSILPDPRLAEKIKELGKEAAQR